MNCGSGDSLNCSKRYGLRSKARQILETAGCDMPLSAATERVDQKVALRGCCSGVLTITASTCSSPIVRAPPRRDSSLSPFSRRSVKSRRHLPA